MNKRLYFHQRGVNFEYWQHHEHFINDRVDNGLWFIEEEKILRIGFSKPLFELINLRYDGHTIKGFTFFGVSITVAYTYHSRNVDQIRKELEAPSLPGIPV